LQTSITIALLSIRNIVFLLLFIGFIGAEVSYGPSPKFKIYTFVLCKAYAMKDLCAHAYDLVLGVFGLGLRVKG
jgi:hypothetical protein